MTLASKEESRIPLVGILMALGFGALLLWPSIVLGDSVSSGAPPSQYRGPSGEVPGGGPVFFDPPGGIEAPRSPEGWARWEFWFEYEKDALLRRAMEARRDAAGAAVQTPFMAPPTDADVKERILPALRAALRDPNASVRAAAAVALGDSRDVASIPALAGMLRAGVDANRKAAALALGFVGGPAVVEPLSRALEQDPDGEVRSLAAIALGLSGDPAAAAALREALSRSLDGSGREAREMRIAAVTGLGLLRDRAAVPVLQRVLRGDVNDNRARAHAATALGRIGEPAAVPPLVATLRDEPDAAVRRSAALALGAFKDDTATAELLKAAEHDGDGLVRGFAAVSYARGAGPAAVARLAALTTIRHDRSLRGFAAVALGLTEDPKNAAPVLRALLEGRSEDSLRSAAAVGLGLLGDRTAVKALAGLVADPSATPELRGYALLGAALAGDAEIGALVKEVLARKVPTELQRCAALAAGVRPFPGSAGILVKVLMEGRDPTVRGAALLGLGLSPDRGAVPLLADIAAEGSGMGTVERIAATGSLAQLSLGGALPPVSRLAAGVNYRDLTPALEEATRVF